VWIIILCHLGGDVDDAIGDVLLEVDQNHGIARNDGGDIGTLGVGVLGSQPHFADSAFGNFPLENQVDSVADGGNTFGGSQEGRQVETSTDSTPMSQHTHSEFLLLLIDNRLTDVMKQRGLLKFHLKI